MSNLLKVSVATLALVSTSAFAGFGSVYVDGVSDKGFTGNGNQEHVVLGIDGGFSNHTGDYYGFLEQDATLHTTFGKASVHLETGSNISVYVQGTYFNDNDSGFDAKTMTLAAGYKGFAGDGWSLRPYVGALWDDGSNEFQPTVGWAGFTNLSPKIYMTSWGESAHLDGVTNLQGDVGIYYNITPKLHTGVQYRFSYDKLGIEGYDDSLGLRIGYRL